MSVLKGLSLGANMVVAAMKQNIDSNQLPKDIKSAISISPASKRGTGTYIIDIIIDLTVAPMAGAFEFGSGLHSTKGPQQTYEITPKNAPKLAFPASRWPGYKPPPEAPEWFVFSVVNHPGVAPRPYLRPAIQSSLPALRQLLGDSFRAEIMRGVKVMEVIR